MNFRKFKRAAQLNLRNAIGWSTNRKIVVIESDDWGSIRMPSIEVFNRLLSARIRVDNCPYNKYDSLESEEDLSSLIEVLSNFSDHIGNHPIITTNFITANPDFHRIKLSGFTNYYYELFTDTYKRYPFHENVFEIFKQGIHAKLFFPQFHGREHLNVNRWMAALQKNLPETRFAFENELFGLSTTITNEKRRSYLAAFDLDDIGELEDHTRILSDGLDLFFKIFGYRSETFIAANYIWHRSLEKILADKGVKYIQGTFNQIEPSGGGQAPTIMAHRLGRKSDFSQIYLTRNAFFEPSLNIVTDPVDQCLKQIDNAFMWNKPAIITSHRLNYIGSIVKENRESNLKLLTDLFNRIIKTWKNVEFLNSTELGSYILTDTKG